jgi:hypothetical protein
MIFAVIYKNRINRKYISALFLASFQQQSLVEIGSVVSEEKIFFNFIPLFFYF